MPENEECSTLPDQSIPRRRLRRTGFVSGFAPGNFGITSFLTIADFSVISDRVRDLGASSEHFLQSDQRQRIRASSCFCSKSSHLETGCQEYFEARNNAL